MKVQYFCIFILFTVTFLSSCTLYSENEDDLIISNINDEVELIEPATIRENRNVKVLDNNNLNSSISKLNVETKKIEAEIGTLLETF